jgi:hypothetical protein
VGAAVTVLTVGKFGDSRGERKRAEDALKWADAFLATQKRDIPLDGLRETLEQFRDSKSRTLQGLAQKLGGE